MTWVKVCGLTRREDVDLAVAAGADAVGFVMVPTSPRLVSIEQLALLAHDVDCTTVALTFALSPGEARHVVAATGVTGVQPYGDHAREVAEAITADGLVALLPGSPSDRTWLDGLSSTVTPMLDTPSPIHGGSGRTFDWSIAADVGRNFVLAGGLGPDNVAKAIAVARPWGVDASSRLELAPGIKDQSKVAAFIEEAKNG